MIISYICKYKGGCGKNIELVLERELDREQQKELTLIVTLRLDAGLSTEIRYCSHTRHCADANDMLQSLVRPSIKSVCLKILL